MSRFQVVVRHLQQLQQYLQRLYALQSLTREEVLTDWRAQSQVERNLQLAIEVVISVAEQMVALLNLPTPESAGAAIAAIAQAGVISSDLGRDLEMAVGFRNILVHNYMEIDYELVYKALQENLGQFERFIEQVARFIHEQRG
ncbi:MAG: type VII toxin-antitoxin system HepT family RNase toxin [Chloroflexia bacterium]